MYLFYFVVLFIFFIHVLFTFCFVDVFLFSLSLLSLSLSCSCDFFFIFSPRFKTRAVLFLLLVWTLLFSVYFATIEEITFLDGLWFTVCSFTTIGLGDVTPRVNYRWASVFFIFFGLGFVSMAIDAMVMTISKNMVRRRRRRRYYLHVFDCGFFACCYFFIDLPLTSAAIGQLPR